MQKEIIRWYSKHKRDLPWRQTSSWGVLISEFMLQQTPVTRVLPIWNEWIERWPTPIHLARSPRAEVIRAWGNLGFPRRAIRLHETAIQITEKYDGKVPDRQKDLRLLPGVGEYTAAAVVAFGFHKKSLVLDTNIRRLLFRLIDGIEFPPAHITNLERENRTVLIPSQAAKWAAATMELGALICTARKPICEKCPVLTLCMWRRKGFPKTSTPTIRSVWQGSNRHCRGTILKSLRASTSVTKESLTLIWPDSSQLEFAIDSLIKDGLIMKIGSEYQLMN